MVAGFAPPTAGEILVDGRADHAHAARAPQHRRGVPELRAVPAHDGRRERRLPAARCAAARRPRSRARCGAGARHGAACRARRRACRGSSRAASSSASRSPAPWCSSPALLLMDEPLGALDRKLREQMQLEIKRIHSDAGRDRPLRHPRPGRGADHVRPHRADEPRPDRAARHGRGALRAAGQPFRGELHRRIESARGPCRVLGRGRRLRARGRRAAAPVSGPAGIRSGRVMHAHGAAGEDRAGIPRRPTVFPALSRPWSTSANSPATGCAWRPR